MDVLVIGGGITGVSLLHHLARPGLGAVLVERTHLAAGASGRNAGFLLAGVAASYAEAVRVYGRDKARDIWRLTSENHDAMLEAVAGQEVGHERRGSAVLASGPDEAKQLAESEQLLREDGFDARWDGQRRTIAGDGGVNPSSLVAALARRAHPLAIREGVNVTALEADRHGVTVHSGGEECHAGAVILATNAYTPQLVAKIAIQPRRGQVLAAGPIAESVSDMPTYLHYGYRYWRQLATGQVVIGGWRDTALDGEVGYDERPTPEIQAHLDAQLDRLGAVGTVTHRWAGTMGFTESGLPLVGPVEGLPNVHVCAGFNGHGLGFAFLSAKRLVDSL
ncbi:MAG TPA: FAD-dependent oxidoreductase [Candidatus Dormibacteraeota bacterium]|nr:FAD-dependent oxidoreductase [Candidatus Dormibacteraeota bacterium]